MDIDKCLNFCRKEHEKLILVKMYTRYLRSEEMLIFKRIVLKTGE